MQAYTKETREQANPIREVVSQIDIVDAVDSDVYHNTELLLKLYRKVLFRVNRKLTQVSDEVWLSDRQELSTYIASMTAFDTKNRKAQIYEKLLSMENSLSLLEVMEEALVALKEYPERGDVHYRILRFAYFDEIRMTHEEIMEYCNLSYSTYYRYRRSAVKTYAAMLWGYIIPELDMVFSNRAMARKPLPD